MQHQRTLIRIFGVFLVMAALPFIAMSAILLNQQIRLIRVTWGIFNPEVNGTPVSTASAMVVSGLVGLALVVGGLALARWPRRSDA